MTANPFDVQFDAARRLLVADVRGRWELADVKGYENAVQALIADKIKPGPDAGYRVLVDISRQELQTREVSEALQRSLATLRDDYVDKVALVSSDSALVKLQAKRVAQDMPMRMFGSRAEALSWLSQP